MWSLGAPGYLLAAVAGAAVVVALHLLAWRRPRPTPLPTARFIPPSPERAVARHVRLSDGALLAARVAALLLLGLAIAAPRHSPAQRGQARVIVADHSRVVASVAAVRDSVARLAADGVPTRLIWFADAPSAPRDAAGAPPPDGRAERRGSLSAALVAAIREGHRLARDADSVAIVVVSPFAREAVDAATGAIAGRWGESLGAVRVAARPPPPPFPAARPALPASSDPVGAAFRLAVGDAPRHPLRVMREAPAAADTAWARAGGVLVHWPDTAGTTPGERRPRAVTTGRRALVAELTPLPLPAGGEAIAWWDDGAVAAKEWPLEGGCVRRVGFVPSAQGDLPLRPALGDVARALATPCGGADFTPLGDAEVATLLGRGASVARAAERGTDGGETGGDDAWRRWLLTLALLVLGGEWWLRRRGEAVVPAGAARAAGTTSREAA